MIYRRLMAILIATTLSLGTAVVPCLSSLALVSDQAAETLIAPRFGSRAARNTSATLGIGKSIRHRQYGIWNQYAPGHRRASLLDTSPVCHIQLENAQRLYLLEFLWTPPAPVGQFAPASVRIKLLFKFFNF